MRLEIFEFVKGAVSDKDLSPILTNFHIYDGKIQGFNGWVAIEAKFEKEDGKVAGLNVTVPADDLINSFKMLRTTEVDFSIEGSKLFMRTKKPKAQRGIDMSDPSKFPLMAPPKKAKKYVFNKPIIPLLKTIRPFVSDNALQLWACGALLHKGNIYATNNFVLVKAPFPWDEPEPVNIPSMALDEIVRIGKEPKHVLFDQESITFVYGSGRWLYAKLFSNEWPEKFHEYVKSVRVKLKGLDIEQLKEDVESLMFVLAADAQVVTGNKMIRMAGDPEAEKKGTVDIKNLPAVIHGRDYPDSTFKIGDLKLVLDAATAIDLSPYPKACPFIGKDGLVGVISG